MELRLNRNILLREIQKIQNITPIKATKPILSNFLMRTVQDGFFATATNLNVGIKVFVPAEIIKPGEICLPARFVHDIVRELPEDSIIDIYMEEGNRLRFSCMNSIFHVPSTTTEEFPPFPEFHQLTDMGQIPAEFLIDMFNKINIAVPITEQKLYGAPPGGLLEVGDSSIMMAGTDGLRMAYVRLDGLDLKIQRTTILPKKLIDELPAMLADLSISEEKESPEVKIGFTENQILLSWSNTQMFARLLENRFPDYKGPISVKNEKIIVLNKERFRQSVRRVSLISEKKEWFIRFKLMPGKLYLDSEKPELGDAHDEIDVDYDGEPLDIGFNPKFILDFLSVINSEEVCLEMQNQKSLAILRPKDNLNIKFIIMPVRL